MIKRILHVTTLKEQALEVINKNGNCPTNTFCSNCFYTKVTGSAKTCDPSNSIKIARDIINKEITTYQHD